MLRPSLEKLSVGVEVCGGARSGSEILLSEKFDAVIVDCDDLQGGLDVLQELRKGTSNRNSVAFAILNGKTTASQAFQMGANFVLQKPISLLNSMRCFNAALGFMYREQRRYFRHPVEMPIVISFGQGKELKTTATNLEEGRAVAAAGIDAVVAQGYEAGGHRGVFDPDAPDDRLGTMALFGELPGI